MSKKLLCYLLLLGGYSGQIYAQSVLGALQNHQKSLPTVSPTTANSSSGVEVGPSDETIGTSRVQSVCTSNDQNSFPLKYVLSLVLDPSPKLGIQYDAMEKTLKVSSPAMIGNCSDMIKWSIRKSKNEPHYYAVEALINKSNCEGASCKYTIRKKMTDGSIVSVTKNLAPSLQGFEQCLKEAGVVSGTTVNPAGIVNDSINAKFDGILNSADVRFVSEGPSAQNDGGIMFGTIDKDQCLVYEKISSDEVKIVSLADQEKKKILEEKDRVCESGDILQIADFLSKNQAFAEEVQQFLNPLILEAAKKVAVKMDKMASDSSITLSPEDIETINLFKRYIVDAEVTKLKNLYREYEASSPEDKRIIQGKIDSSKAKLREYGGKPYFTEDKIGLLISKGEFDQAENLHSLRLSVKNYQGLGNKERGEVISAGLIEQRISDAAEDFSDNLEEKKEEFKIKTGQEAGKSDYYFSLARARVRAVEIRTQNYNSEIMSELDRIRQGGFCYAYFRNTQKCIQDSMQRIEQLKAEVAHFNKIDQERAGEYQAEGEKYLAWENEGERHIASQYGEEAPEPKAAPEISVTPAPRSDDGSYTFDIPQTAMQMPAQGQGQQQFPQQNPWMMQQQNPWMMQNQMGMGMQQGMYPQNNGFGGGMNFNFGGGMGMGMQQNPWMMQNQMGMGMGMQQNPWMMQNQMGMGMGMQQNPWMMPGMHGSPSYMLPPFGM